MEMRYERSPLREGSLRNCDGTEEGRESPPVLALGTLR